MVCQLFEGELSLHSLEIGFGEVNAAVLIPGLIKGEEMNVSVGDVATDNFPDSTGAEDLLHVFADFFDSLHEGFVICVF